MLRLSQPKSPQSKFGFVFLSVTLVCVAGESCRQGSTSQTLDANDDISGSPRGALFASAIEPDSSNGTKWTVTCLGTTATGNTSWEETDVSQENIINNKVCFPRKKSSTLSSGSGTKIDLVLPQSFTAFENFSSTSSNCLIKSVDTKTTLRIFKPEPGDFCGDFVKIKPVEPEKIVAACKDKFTSGSEIFLKSAQINNTLLSEVKRAKSTVEGCPASSGTAGAAAVGGTANKILELSKQSNWVKTKTDQHITLTENEQKCTTIKTTIPIIGSPTLQQNHALVKIPADQIGISITKDCKIDLATTPVFISNGDLLKPLLVPVVTNPNTDASTGAFE